MNSQSKMTLAAATMLAAAAGVWMVMAPDTPTPQPGTATPEAALVTVRLPGVFSAEAELGRTAFNAKCAACHGENAAGRDGMGPPLVHRIYEPGHHGDMAFQMAVANGATAHHWPFGNMPPVAGLTEADVMTIVVYVRELQRANGIE